MVKVTLDWEAFKEYAEHCRVGAFQITELTGGYEIRVHVGQFAYKGTFKTVTEGEALAILTFCNDHGYIKVEETVTDDLFFA